MKQYFVTGTSTEVGKTWICRALLEAAAQRGLRTLAVKPLAAGCEQTGAGLRNQDAVLLQRTITESLPYERVNPVALEPAIAPHIAAQQVGLPLSAEQLSADCRRTLAVGHDFALIEGAGGWRVPLNGEETLADLAVALNLPVVLVVGMGLGCLNHALLTAEAIQRDGLTLAAWVANSPARPMEYLEANLTALRSRLSAPFLGHVPFLDDGSAAEAAVYLDIDILLTASFNLRHGI